MIEIRFSGWFQCRLATDPDPYDEPRGVSGYVHAYVGEPDLDRTVVFQDPPFSRPLGPPVGVVVDRVLDDGRPLPGHPLLGARVDLLDGPVFEGRNGVIADDGLEPVHPFVLQIVKDRFSLVRAIAPADPAYPYPELLAAGVEGAPEEIREATGIPDLLAVWRERVVRLRQDLAGLTEPERTGTRERLAFLEGQIAAGGGAARFFGARMRYEYELGSEAALEDPDGWLPEAGGAAAPWPVRFWFGGWDADALCGYARGTLEVGAPPRARAGHPEGVTDRRP